MEVEKSSLTRSSTSNRAKVTHDQLHGVTHKMSPHAINRSDNTKYEQNPMNKVDSPTTHFNTRLFNARKQFSKPSVPIISFDDQISPTTSPQSSRSTYSRNVMYKTDSMESKTSVPVSPTELSYTSNFEKNLSYITTTMRALSTSPRKGSPNALIPPYNKTLLPLAFSFDAINPEYPGDKANILPQTNKGVSDKISHETHNANRSNKKGSLSPKPYLLKSSHVTGKIYMPNTLSAVTPMALAASGDDVMLSLVHQRSTESHDSSISMPSATSSGGSPYTSSASHLLKSIRKEDKLYRSTDVNFNMDEQRMPNPEQHIIRRSSYEMATGKLELPIKKSKKKTWKEALCSLKAKKDLLFKKRMKQSDECMEFGDPVYHLLRCAASPGHQPSTCKCICHLESGDECPKVISEMTKPMNVICAPAARRKSNFRTYSPHPLNNTPVHQQFNFSTVNDQTKQPKIKCTPVLKKNTTNSNSQPFVHQTQS